MLIFIEYFELRNQQQKRKLDKKQRIRTMKSKATSKRLKIRKRTFKNLITKANQQTTKITFAPLNQII